MADTLNIYRDPNAPPEKSGGAGIWIATIVICLLAGGIAWWLLRDAEHAPPPPPPDAGAPAKPTLPPSSESDAKIRSMAGTLSTEPEWAEWLKQSDLLGVITVATYNVSEGESPRVRLQFLRPADPFKAIEKKDKKTKQKKLYIDPASFARYDMVARVVGSIDAAGAARIYKEIEQWLDLSTEQIAGPKTHFSALFGRAVNRLAAVPVLEGDIEVVEDGLVFKYADPALEGLSAAEKHLLRMGPKNAKTIQAKLTELQSAMFGGGASATTGDGGTATGSMGDGGTTMGAAPTGSGSAGPAAGTGSSTGTTGTTGSGTTGPTGTTPAPTGTGTTP